MFFQILIRLAGQDSSAKIDEIRKKMKEQHADAFVISALDEVMCMCHTCTFYL